MGIVMYEAFYSVNNVNIDIDYATENFIKDNLYCITPECRIPLVFVRSFTRQINGTNTKVRAYFRIKSGAEEHKENCRFNTLGSVKIIARDSSDVLTSIENGLYNFRLNLITSALKAAKSINSSIDSKAELSQSYKATTKKYENKGSIDPYLSTMNRILKLRAEIEDNKELSTIISLDFNNQKVKWSNFYFEREDYKKCFTYLNKNKVEHPICMEGKISGIMEPNNTYNYYVVKLTPNWVEHPDNDGIKRIPSVTINISNKKLGEFLQTEFIKGKKNLAFYSTVQTKSKIYNKNVTYLNIIGNINNKQQFHFL